MLKSKVQMKITVNRKEYSSIEEVPEELRQLIKESIVTKIRKGGLGGPTVSGRSLFKFRLGRPLSVEFEGPPESPKDYRLAAESAQSGRIPEGFPLEDFLSPLLVISGVFIIGAFIRQVSSGKSTDIPSILAATVFAVVLPILGVVWLGSRRQRRMLYPVLQEIALLIPGAFVVVVQGSPRLHVARDEWNGVASFVSGSEDDPTCSRFIARVFPSPAVFRVRARHLLSRFTSGFSGESVETGDAEFDRRYTINANDGKFALSMMDISGRQCLERLGALGKPLVDVAGGRVLIQVNKNLARMHGSSGRVRDTEMLRSFLAGAVAFSEAASRLSPHPPAPGRSSCGDTGKTV